MHSSPMKIPVKGAFDNYGYGMPRNKFKAQEQFSYFSSSGSTKANDSSLTSSLEGNPFIYRRSNSNYYKRPEIQKPLPYEPPQCKFGAIGSKRRISQPIEEIWNLIEVVSNTHMPAQFPLGSQQISYYNQMNNKGSSEALQHPVNSPSKPWKEMKGKNIKFLSFFTIEIQNLQDVSDDDSLGTDINDFFRASNCIAEGNNDFSFLDIHDGFELEFFQPSPVQKVEDYKSFREPFARTQRRSSTPIRCLIEDFKDKCSLDSDSGHDNSQQCHNASSSNFKENLKPAPATKIRSNRVKRKHSPKVEKTATVSLLMFQNIFHKFSSSQGCSYCWKTGQLEVITISHTLKDLKGRTLCPFLRVRICPLCHGDGDYAHTYDECPARIFMESPTKSSNDQNQKRSASKAHRRLNFF